MSEQTPSVERREEVDRLWTEHKGRFVNNYPYDTISHTTYGENFWFFIAALDAQSAEHARNLEVQIKDLEADLPWRCFHCGGVFTRAEEAKEHFGSEPCVTQAEVTRLHDALAAAERRIYELESSHQWRGAP